MPSALMLSVAFFIIMLCVTMQRAITMCVIMINVIMLSVIALGVIMLSVVMLNVVAPNGKLFFVRA
jgi:hypothetical protein